MKTLIVCVSVSHGNTRKVADELADVLGATVAEPEEVDAAELATYDLVGFGSGIFGLMFHPRLLRFVRRAHAAAGQKAFTFATRGGPDLGYTAGLSRVLRRKGFDTVGTFSCRGFDTWLPLRLVGGINKTRPGPEELAAARAFATLLRDTLLVAGPKAA